MLSLDQEYHLIRIRQQKALERRTEEAYRKCPALQENALKRASLFKEVACGKLDRESAKEAFAANETERAALLHAIGMEESALSLQYDCPDCKDTGFVGEPLRRPCRCRLMLQAKLDPRVRINEVETFPHFDESIYPTLEQCTQAKKAAQLLETFVNSLPCPNPLNYLILGAPGLGKSYLGNAAAYHALELGVDAVRTTAYDFLEDVMSELRGEPVSRRRFRNAPLLILDDIGTEAMVPNITENAFFSVIDGRSQKRLPTIYITNLTLNDLRERYGDRIFSRLIDTRSTRILNLQGKNLRYGNR